MDVGVTSSLVTPSSGLSCQEIKRRVPAAGLRGGRYVQYTPAEKLAARIIKGPSCWEVQGHQQPNGYVQISQSKGQPVLYAHRLAYELAHGPIPTGCVVMHSCDNPRCANPAHLSVGTQRDNVHDAVRKGRWGATKITDAQVAELRALGTLRIPHRLLAEQFGIARSTVKHILAGRMRVVHLDRSNASSRALSDTQTSITVTSNASVRE